MIQRAVKFLRKDDRVVYRESLYIVTENRCVPTGQGGAHEWITEWHLKIATKSKGVVHTLRLLADDLLEIDVSFENEAKP